MSIGKWIVVHSQRLLTTSRLLAYLKDDKCFVSGKREGHVVQFTNDISFCFHTCSPTQKPNSSPSPYYPNQDTNQHTQFLLFSLSPQKPNRRTLIPNTGQRKKVSNEINRSNGVHTQSDGRRFTGDAGLQLVLSAGELPDEVLFLPYTVVAAAPLCGGRL